MDARAQLQLRRGQRNVELRAELDRLANEKPAAAPPMIPLTGM